LGETGQNNAGVAGTEGHSKFLQKQWLEGAKQGKIIAARGSGWFAGKGPCGKKASLLT